ncbi:leucine--tRNA ligase [Clostridium hydrogenum]|uniref:leucine--tRNA ligase n=1 Tax=Clostridium hydrogenum TaxID=2855764 RepID=UPI001EEEB3C7|nr:leucine--tRNA ligase [Clostridium hydrogenum]
MKKYNPKQIEQKWHEIWQKEQAFKTGTDKSKPKYYALIEFPYPSGKGIHVGHPRPYTAMDIIARKRRLQGYNVLFPMGWDAFGLPTENFAIKNKIHPKLVTEKNIERFKGQLNNLGYSFDWSREINTTEPSYYKWTQWIFLKLFKKGLAYKAEMPINWCPSCKVGLANEEVVNGKCERCGAEVVRRVKKQWMLKITAYADKLIEGLNYVDYIEKVKTQQRNWIGRSKGAEINFKISETSDNLTIFTTHPETLFGVTYMVISPEHPLINKYKDRIKNFAEVEEYKNAASKKSDFERTELSKEKTGVALKGINAINPANSKEIPVWISDYVIMSYGTGAIMAVPAHDDRDFEFADKFKLPIIKVINENNTLINSNFLNELTSEAGKEKIIEWLEDKKIGFSKINYKLRDWVFSRQRYWGEPIPLVHCEKCGWVPVPESELPLKLPEVSNYLPTATGESPLANMESWIETTCPKCGGKAKRETDTMPQWAGSSWYFLRYIDPHNDKEFADKEEMKYWLPVDWYNGGMEHTTLHLLYSRFWHKFLYAEGYVPTPEPYMKRTSHGMILGENNEKMSKSRGNVINPDDLIDEYGADTLRTYEMFIGAFEQSTPWSNNGLSGCRKFLERVWKLQELLTSETNYSNELSTEMHKTIKKVSEDFENLKFNTAIAALMTLTNKFYAVKKITTGELKTFLILLNPAAPHITEEMWELLGFGGRLYSQKWPAWEDNKIKDDFVEIAVQINGKLKTTIKIDTSSNKEAVRNKIIENSEITKYFADKKIIKEIYVKGKIYNFVVK